MKVVLPCDLRDSAALLADLRYYSYHEGHLDNDEYVVIDLLEDVTPREAWELIKFDQFLYKAFGYIGE